jgi:hypothetical protein
MIAIIPERVIGMPRNTDRHRPESAVCAFHFYYKCMTFWNDAEIANSFSLRGFKQ